MAYVQNDKGESVIPSASEESVFSKDDVSVLNLSFRAPARNLPFFKDDDSVLNLSFRAPARNLSFFKDDDIVL
jgi:hypothetical protein